jgi:hypothetical protein
VLDSVYDNDDWDLFDSQWWGVQLFICFDLALDPEVYTSVDVFLWAMGTPVWHAPDQCHRSRPPLCEISWSSCMGEGVCHGSVHQRIGDGVLPIAEAWVVTDDQAEFVPMWPMLIHCYGTLVRNSCLDPLIDKAEVSAQCMRLHYGKSCQYCVWGECNSK